MLLMCSDRCHNLSGETMGTARWHAQFWLPEGADPSPFQSAFQKAVDTVDAQMSLWKPHSDLCRLNAAPVGEWVTVPAALFAVLDQAQLRFHELSYDAAQAASRMQKHGLTQGYHQSLLTGYWPSEDVVPRDLRGRAKG